jgi:phosphoserine aminotransferase
VVRVYNFSPGPATLPLPVLEQAQAELLDWSGLGASVLEVSHRSREFMRVAQSAESDLRSLLAIPENYRVLFLQGGASAQFAAVPLNLTAAGDTADYLDTGIWSAKAISEARRYVTVNVVADGQASGYVTVPPSNSWRLTPHARYLHYTANETISGVEIFAVPEMPGAQLVADVSSTILSRPIPVDRYAVLYAGAQKNLGPSGLTVVIVRADLLGRARDSTPSVLNYQAMAEAGSMFNTPPTFAWYVTGLVLRWLKSEGGLTVMAERNARKAEALYDCIDRSSGFYRNHVAREYRSRMNVTFRLPSEALETEFLAAAEAAGLTNLAGHRAVGGLRASLYNALPEAGVAALIEFMRDFARRRG